MDELTPEVMWEAVKTNNPAYNGRFYYGVKSTGIFCRPSCKSKRPNKNNVRFFSTSLKALGEGYRPCKRCRPDLENICFDPLQELTARVTRLLETEYSRPEILSELPIHIGISQFHLQRCYKKQTGLTPRLYLQKIRVQKALELLTNQAVNNTEICFALGFQSLSNFYAAFHSEMGLPPGVYRRMVKKATPEDDNHESCI